MTTLKIDEFLHLVKESGTIEYIVDSKEWKRHSTNVPILSGLVQKVTDVNGIVITYTQKFLYVDDGHNFMSHENDWDIEPWWISCQVVTDDNFAIHPKIIGLLLPKRFSSISIDDVREHTKSN